MMLKDVPFLWNSDVSVTWFNGLKSVVITSIVPYGTPIPIIPKEFSRTTISFLMIKVLDAHDAGYG